MYGEKTMGSGMGDAVPLAVVAELAEISEADHPESRDYFAGGLQGAHAGNYEGRVRPAKRGTEGVGRVFACPVEFF